MGPRGSLGNFQDMKECREIVEVYPVMGPSQILFSCLLTYIIKAVTLYACFYFFTFVYRTSVQHNTKLHFTGYLDIPYIFYFKQVKDAMYISLYV